MTHITLAYSSRGKFRIAHVSHFPHKMNSTVFVPIVPTCDPGMGPSLTPGASYE